MSASEIDNKSFILRLKKGDELAHKQLYMVYYPKLLHIAMKFGSSVQSPRDFVQEAFYKVMKNRAQLNENASLDAQMISICKNHIYNHVKRENRIQNVEEFPEDWFLEEEINRNDEETQKRYNKLMALVEQMPPKRKELFILHKIEKYSYKEIEEITGLSPKTIANQLNHAKNFLLKNMSS